MKTTLILPRFARVYARHTLGIVGVVVLVVFIALAILAPTFSALDPYTMDLDNTFRPDGLPGTPVGNRQLRP